MVRSPDLHGGKAGLDRRPRRNAEIVRQRLGFEMGEIGGHALQHNVGEPRAEPIAVRAAVDLAGQRRGPLACAAGQFGRRQLKRRQALARIVPSCKRDGLQGALADRLTRLLRQPRAEHTADQLNGSHSSA